MNSNFCSYPFKHLSIGQNSELRACCVAKSFSLNVQDVADLDAWWKQDEAYRELRDSHRRGEQHPACATCWRQEEEGVTSMRQRVTTAADTDTELLRYIEITGGRLCNLACRMCSPHSSNQIEREHRPWSNYKISGPVNWLDDEKEQDKLLKILCTPSLQSIYFTGGEPQIMPCYQQLLGKWAQLRDPGGLAMHLNTNCTVYNTEFWELIKRFYHKQIDFSIDGTGEMYERIRFTDWNKVRTNMFRIRDSLIDLGRNVFSLTIVTQLANVDQGLELQALYDEFASETRSKTSYQVLLIPVTGNTEWSWRNLPVEILQAALDKLGNATGPVVELYRQDLMVAIRNNGFNIQYARDVINKERWFKMKNDVCIWDIREDWLEIYQRNR